MKCSNRCKTILMIICILLCSAVLVFLTVYLMCNGDSHKFDDKVPDQFVVISHEYLFQMHKHEYIVYDKDTKFEYLYLIDDKYSTDALLLPILDSNENVMVYTGE